MDKQQLIEYLDAVCDAESAVQACTDSIAMYKEKRNRIYKPSCPKQPIKETVMRGEPKPFSFFNGYFPAVLFWFLVYAFGFGMLIAIFIDPSFEPMGLIFFSLFLAVFTPPIVHHYIENKSIKQAYVKSTQRTAQQYQTAMTNYENELVTYNKTCDLSNSATSIFDKAIQQQEIVCAETQNRLNHLYKMNVLYPSFRNLIAAYQIREYLQMGICETLDGPTGAYAQYMLDVRTERICTSINDLRDAVINAIHSLQSTLVHELRHISTNINEVSHSLETNFNMLNSSILSMQDATSAQLDAHFTEANHHLSVMSQNIASTSHNQYIQQRLQNVDTYLLRAPVNPS